MSKQLVRFGLFLVVCALAPARPAQGYSARLDWPSVSGAAGYKVYSRLNTNPYGTGVDVGALAPGSDGIVHYVAPNLTRLATNSFAIASYTSSRVESARSNEISVTYAMVAAVIDSDGDGLTDAQEDLNLNGIVDAGETDPLSSNGAAR